LVWVSASQGQEELQHRSKIAKGTNIVH